MTNEVTLACDRKFCVAMLPQVSRTFALSIEALPASLRDAVRTAYLLCRIVDSIEDAPAVSLPERERLFATFDRALGREAADPRALERRGAGWLDGLSPAERELARGSGAVFRAFRALPSAQRDAIRPRVLVMSSGMREYATRSDSYGAWGLRDEEDLERYCYFVAGTVGELLTELFLQAVPVDDPRVCRALRERAVSFGLGLQLVNIVKDVAADRARGVCFLPIRQAAEHGVRLEDILESSCRSEALALLRRICERARQHLRRAEQYTLLWPVPAAVAMRLFCAVPLALALATLGEVEAGHDTLRAGRSPKVSRETVARVLTDARAAVADDVALARMLALHPASSASAGPRPRVLAQCP